MFYGKNLRNTALFVAILLSNIPSAQAMEKEVESGNRKGWNIVQRISDDARSTTEEDVDFLELEVEWKIFNIDLEKMEEDLNCLPRDILHKFYVIQSTRKNQKGLSSSNSVYLIDTTEEEIDRLAEKTIRGGIELKKYAIEMTEEGALLSSEVRLMRLLSAGTKKNDAAFQKDQKRRVKVLAQKVRKFLEKPRPEKFSRKIPI